MRKDGMHAMLVASDRKARRHPRSTCILAVHVAALKAVPCRLPMVHLQQWFSIFDDSYSGR